MPAMHTPNEGGDTNWAQIVELTSNMGLLVDARDWQPLQELFADQVHVDYTSLWGGEPETVSSAELVGDWRELLDRLRATQHLIAGQVVTVEGERATCIANVQGTHVDADDNRTMFTVAGRYDLALLRRAGAWRIAALKLTVQWTAGDPSVLNLPGASS